MNNSRKKLLQGLGAVLAVLLVLPLFAAFEGHVVNVKAKIENALKVTPRHINFGTVFPNELLFKHLTVSLSPSFLEQDRVNDVEYVIKQKLKCKRATPTQGIEIDPQTGDVAGGDPNVIEIKCTEFYPDLRPFLSKHKHPSEGVENDVEHPVGTTVEAGGLLDKSAGDIVDRWLIDLKVPCFKGECRQGEIGVLDPASEGQVFGADLWIEVIQFSYDGRIDMDGINTIGPGGLPDMDPVAKGAALTGLPLWPFATRVDMIDADASTSWTPGDTLMCELVWCGGLANAVFDNNPTALDKVIVGPIPADQTPVNFDLGISQPPLGGAIVFWDGNANGQYDNGEDIFYDANRNGIFD